ncbi:MAG: glycosyltransferase family 2 protein [archaeon]
MKEPISLVILAHNEADIIEQTVRDYYREVISKIPGSEFIIAEDGSTDGTKEILTGLQKELPIRVILGDQRKGYTKAMLEGLSLAKNDVVFFSDSDGQHDPKDFWLMYPHIKKYDIVSGQKSHRKDGMLRVAVSYGMNGALSLLFGKRLHDANSGFKLIRRSVIAKLAKEKFVMKLASAEFMARAIGAGFRVTEVYVKHFERKYGESRGIPTGKIPGLILETMAGLVKVKTKLMARR